MTWRKSKGKDGYERRCSHCDGTGNETLTTRRSHNCNCPFGSMDKVEHPANTASGAIRSYIERCNGCGLFWWVSEEASDDSLDIPGPVCLGVNLPGEDWRFKEAESAR